MGKVKLDEKLLHLGRALTHLGIAIILLMFLILLIFIAGCVSSTTGGSTDTTIGLRTYTTQMLEDCKDEKIKEYERSGISLSVPGNDVFIDIAYEQCQLEFAKELDNPEICKQISNSPPLYKGETTSRADCFTYFAIKNEDISLCDAISDLEDDFREDNCKNTFLLESGGGLLITDVGKNNVTVKNTLTRSFNLGSLKIYVNDVESV